MYTVMIVEDDSDQLLILSTVVSSYGYNVVTATSKVEALSILRSNVSVDVLFTDYKLGDGTGVEILAEMRGRSPCIMTILYSGFCSLPASLGGGFDDYITKPVSEDLLKRTLVSVLEVRQQRQEDADKGERAA